MMDSRIQQLGEVCDVLDNKRKPVTKTDRKPGPYPYYGATGVQDYVAGFIFDEPLVLIGEDGARWGAGENSAFKVDGKYWVNNHAHVLRPHRDVVLDDWLTFFLNSSDLMPHITGTTVKKLNQEKLKSIQIPLPPIGEQRRIVERIEKQFAKIDEAIRLREQSLAATDALLPATLHKIFEEGKQKGWDLAAVENLCDIKGGKRLPKGHKLTNEKTAHPYIRVADFVPYGLDLSDLKYIDDDTFAAISRYTIGPNDVFISIAGTIGAVGVIPDLLDGANLTENAAKLTNLRNVEQRFLMYMLSSEDVQQQIKTDSIQTTIAKLGLFRIARLKIPLPPLAEQKKIVAKLDALSEKVRTLQTLQTSQLSALKALKQSILHEVFDAGV